MDPGVTASPKKRAEASAVRGHGVDAAERRVDRGAPALKLPVSKPPFVTRLGPTSLPTGPASAGAPAVNPNVSATVAKEVR
jgi:hypothetical protein